MVKSAMPPQSLPPVVQNVTYYAPPAVVAPVVPTTTYYAPAPAPVTTYYAPAPAPVTSYYAPVRVSAYYSPPPVIAPRPVVNGEEALAVLELALAVDAASGLPSHS